MNYRNGPTDTEIERSQAFIAAVLGPEEINRLHNQPPEPVEPEPIIAPEDQRAADSVENADAWLAEYPVIENEVVAKAAADCVEQLEKDLKACKKQFKAEKAPHEAKLAEIRAKFHPRINRFEICLKAIGPRFRAWIALEDRRRKAAIAEEARKVAEAQRRADQLAEQAKTGGRNAVSQAVLAHEAAQEAEAARKAVAAMPARAQVRGNLGGRTHSLRTVWVARLHEYDKALNHYKGHPEVRKLIQTLADADARHGVRYIPGFHVYSEQV